MPPKYKEIARLLEKRIEIGSYALTGLPSEVQFTDEFGVARNTIRKATELLIDKGVLSRESHRSPVIESGKGRLNVAFLCPGFYSLLWAQFRYAVEGAASRRGINVRAIEYLHWEDPVFSYALNGFDAVFLAPMDITIPRFIEKLIKESGKPVVAFEQDLTPLGVPTVRVFPPAIVQRLLDCMIRGNHRKYHCVNTQRRDAVILERIQQWNVWKAAHGKEGDLIDDSNPNFNHPLSRAHHVMSRFLDSNDVHDAAFLCLTEPCAMGAVRALCDRGIKVGEDVSVSTFSEGMCRYLNPSLTSVEAGDLLPLMKVCVEWIERGGRNWIGSLLLQPPEISLFTGESTRKAR